MSSSAKSVRDLAEIARLQQIDDFGLVVGDVEVAGRAVKSLHALEPLFVAENVTSLGDWLREHA